MRANLPGSSTAIQDCHRVVLLQGRQLRWSPRLSDVFRKRIYRDNQLATAPSNCGPWTINMVERPQSTKDF
jgi:hypothetical protein